MLIDNYIEAKILVLTVCVVGQCTQAAGGASVRAGQGEWALVSRSVHAWLLFRSFDSSGWIKQRRNRTGTCVVCCVCVCALVRNACFGHPGLSPALVHGMTSRSPSAPPSIVSSPSQALLRV